MNRNPTLEEQALARVHRLGQTKSVTTVRFYVRDSFEEVCLANTLCYTCRILQEWLPAAPQEHTVTKLTQKPESNGTSRV
jgi:hypothetical protein